ncbi:hypothetical protein BD289DRAFT_439705 [Coniella lustricola]|uniref:Uncharacterized protein n=1 Tax=Coniella lustricola TaxID=2025994 RepID=A0A2T3A1D9_9PEZI|nr:hypothetical protein BD289DRAFT_439705 [Coniella lustricola]
MADSDSALEAMLVAAVKAIWHSDERDQLTVNAVYKRAEADNGLGDRYFKDGARKDKSRAIVLKAVVSVVLLLRSFRPYLAFFFPSPLPKEMEESKGTRRLSSFVEPTGVISCLDDGIRDEITVQDQLIRVFLGRTQRP